MKMSAAPWDGPNAENVVPLETWKAGLRYKEGGQVLEPKAFVNFRLMMTHNGAVAGKVRLNAFTNEIEVTTPPWRAAGRTATLCDSDIVRAREWLQVANLQPTKEEAYAALVEAATFHSYDPLVDYLTGLTWDGVPRIDGWLVDLFGVRDTTYARAVGPKWLISACARAFDPGCKADYMLVLEGAQDIGKSTALRVLSSPAWFTEFVSDMRDNKRFIEQITGKWIIEFAELAAMKPAEMEIMKAVITTQVDRVRLAYARTTTEMPRRCVLAATINPRAEGAYLTDETGNKRFWPVRCTAIDLPALERDRDQIWAEAVQRYRAGERWWLTDFERGEAVRQQAARVAVSPWEEWLSQPGRLAAQAEWTSIELLEKLGVTIKDQTQANKNEVARVMVKLGWKNQLLRQNGKVSRIWLYSTE